MPDKTTYKALANGTLVAHVPLTFARTPCGGRLFAQEDGRNRDRNKELATVQTVALGALWRRVAAGDRFPTRFKMAEHLRIDSSYLTRVIRLGYLSPYIVEKIAAGDLPHVSLETLMKLQTPLWAEQHKALGID